jgi:hypothetical protein
MNKYIFIHKNSSIVITVRADSEEEAREELNNFFIHVYDLEDFMVEEEEL